MNDYLERPTWAEYGLDLAKAVATRADCTRRKVGAVLMDTDHRIVATGYNGAPARGKSCLKGECPRGTKTTEELPGYQHEPTSYDIGPGSCIALHAEQNVLLRASWGEMIGSSLYVTSEPCMGCWRMIGGTPIKDVTWPLLKDERRAYRYHHAMVRNGEIAKVQ